MWSYVVGLPTFFSVTAGTCAAVTVAWTGAESTAVARNAAWAAAVFVIEPASMSLCLTVADAEHVTEAAGASVTIAGHVTVTLSSVTVTGPISVTLPLFVTT